MFLITQPQVLLSTFPFMQIRVALTASYNLILLCEGILVSKSPNSLFITSESQVFWNQGAILCYRLILWLLVDRNLKSHQTRTRLVWISLLKLFFLQILQPCLYMLVKLSETCFHVVLAFGLVWVALTFVATPASQLWRWLCQPACLLLIHTGQKNRNEWTKWHSFLLHKFS